MNVVNVVMVLLHNLDILFRVFLFSLRVSCPLKCEIRLRDFVYIRLANKSKMAFGL